MVVWAIICSCSDDESGIPYNLKEACLEEEPETVAEVPPKAVLHRYGNQKMESSVFDEAVSVDTVYFKKNENGAVTTELVMGTRCGSEFSLHTKRVADTLFVNSSFDSDDNDIPSCDCRSLVEFEVPDDMVTAKILFVDERRFFPKVIVLKE